MRPSAYFADISPPTIMDGLLFFSGPLILLIALLIWLIWTRRKRGF
ncbi:hypothetical protein L6R29_21255 [Myxococcota bacterium]|nr:hypothetical protein [Myxococcota bacterium]